MNPLRKIIGFIMAILLGVPILFGTIVAIGLTEATISPAFLSEMPREIIEKLPDTLDQLYAEAEKDDFIEKKEFGSLVVAMKRTDRSPGIILEQSGIMSWMKSELDESLGKLGKVLSGEISAENIKMDMSKLKSSILSPVITSYLKDVIEELPECSDSDLEEWKEVISTGNYDHFPECRPAGVEITPEIVMQIQRKIADDIPDEVTLFEGGEYIPKNINIPKFVLAMTYFLFIFPAIFILLGSLIASTSKGGFFRWSGISILLGGLSAYAFGNLLTNLVPVSDKLSRYYDFSEQFSARYGDILSKKIVEFSDMIMSPLFKPVSNIGGIVAIVGLIVFAISFLNREN